MKIETIQQTWRSYLAAYGDIPADERERLLRQIVTDDIVFSNPIGDEGQGFNSLVEHVGQFQEKNPGGYFASKKLLIHHGQLLSEWTMHKKDGSEVVTAHTYARFDAQGRLTHTAGFWML